MSRLSNADRHDRLHALLHPAAAPALPFAIARVGDLRWPVPRAEARGEILDEDRPAASPQALRGLAWAALAVTGLAVTTALAWQVPF